MTHGGQQASPNCSADSGVWSHSLKGTFTDKIFKTYQYMCRVKAPTMYHCLMALFLDTLRVFEN